MAVTLNFDPFPIIDTDRLQLRALVLSDAKDMFGIRSNAQVNAFLDRPGAQSVADAKQFIQKIHTQIREKKTIFWAINLVPEKQVIGTICLWQISELEASAEIGYELLPEFQGNGIMREAIEAVIVFGQKKMKLTFIDACVHPDNLKSIRLLEAYQFKFNGPGFDEGTISYRLTVGMSKA